MTTSEKPGWEEEVREFFDEVARPEPFTQCVVNPSNRNFPYFLTELVPSTAGVRNQSVLRASRELSESLVGPRQLFVEACREGGASSGYLALTKMLVWW